MANPPFMPVSFQPGPPTKEKGIWEDGPGAFANPPNTGTPVYYGDSQTPAIVNTNPKPPRQTAPNAADKNTSKLQ